MPKYETIFRQLFHPDPSSSLLPSIYTDAASENSIFPVRAKKLSKAAMAKCQFSPEDRC